MTCSIITTNTSNQRHASFHVAPIHCPGVVIKYIGFMTFKEFQVGPCSPKVLNHPSSNTIHLPTLHNIIKRLHNTKKCLPSPGHRPSLHKMKRIVNHSIRTIACSPHCYKSLLTSLLQVVAIPILRNTSFQLFHSPFSNLP